VDISGEDYAIAPCSILLVRMVKIRRIDDFQGYCVEIFDNTAGY
jgi:hypothetical protein